MIIQLLSTNFVRNTFFILTHNQGHKLELGSRRADKTPSRYPRKFQLLLLLLLYHHYHRHPNLITTGMSQRIATAPFL